jgi:hypothetical protein
MNTVVLNDKCPTMTGQAFGDQARTACVLLFCVLILSQNLAPRNIKGGSHDPRSK